MPATSIAGDLVPAPHARRRSCCRSSSPRRHRRLVPHRNPAPSFAEFLAGVRTEALARGIRQEIVDEALSNIDEPLPVVIERDRSQAETVLSLETYLSRRLTPTLVKRDARRSPSTALLLDEVAARYGVPPEVIVGDLGHRVELRRLQRRAADGRRAGDAGVGSAALRVLPQRAVRGTRDSQPRRHRGGAACAARGPARWDSCSSCRRAI